MLILYTTNCCEEEAELLCWKAVLVAPAAMQFLEVAGDVTVLRPSLGSQETPSLPAAKTAVKS
jgi:hypothetical protein